MSRDTFENQTSGRDYSDLPISTPDEDLFGLDGFIQTLAKSLRTMQTPHGVVVALNGAWGSGKSSAVNLLCHHLRQEKGGTPLEVVNFNPWWFRGEEALVIAFLRELYAAMEPSLGKKALEALPKLGARLLKAGSIVAPSADAVGAHGAGAIASGAMQWLGGLIEADESVEKLHRKLAQVLAGQKTRYIVIIDDIDRLSPDEAFAMFRLVKSVGRLPNVAYLLAFDRALAERMVAERFPSEGPHYLEKIVQASFELPPPSQVDLSEQLQGRLFDLVGQPSGAAVVHTMNMILDVVTPEVTTPRDLMRYLNAVSITWPSVADEVSLGDFLALEAYRLFRPKIYTSIRSNKETLCGSAERSGNKSNEAPDRFDRLLLSSVEDVAHYRRGLMRLFPKLQAVWGRVFQRSDDAWSRDRRACSSDHFETYFRLAPADTVAKRAELQALLVQASDPERIAGTLVTAVNSARRGGGTRAATLLEGLRIEAANIPIDRAAILLEGVFSVADTLDVACDEAGAFMIADNMLRIHWLMRALLADRTDVAHRSKIIDRASRSASLGWRVDLASSLFNEHHPREGHEKDLSDRLVSEAAAQRLAKAAVAALRRASRDHTLIEHRRLASLLFRWRELAQDDGRAVCAWTRARLNEDASVVRLASALTSTGWSHSMGFDGLGDRVSTRHDSVHIAGLEKIMDRDRLLARIERLSETLDPNSADAATVQRFLNAREREPD